MPIVIMLEVEYLCLLKQAQFRDPQVTLDNFDFNFNKEMNRSLVFVLLEEIAEAALDGKR